MLTVASRYRTAVAPLFVARVAGLPFGAVADLGAPALAQRLRFILEADRWLQAVAEPICDALFAAVRQVAESDPDLRKRLINAKRDLHNGRLPRDVEVLATLLPAPEQTLLLEWCRRWQARHAAIGTLPQLWDEEADRVSRHMQQWSQSAEFGRGVVLASLPLHEKLQEYATTSLAEQSGRLRKVEPPLAMYLARVAAKTSPFATFAQMAAGVWREQGTGWAWQTDAAEPPRLYSQVSVNQALLTRLAAAAAQHPDLRPYVPLRLNPALQVQDDRFVAYGAHDMLVHRRVAFTAEKLIAIPRTPETERLVAAVGVGGRTCRQVLRSVAGHRGQQRWTRLLERLLAAGVVEATWPVPDSTLNFPLALADALAAIPRQLAKRLRQALLTLTALTERFAAAAAVQRPALLAEIDATIRAACSAVEMEPGDLQPHQLFEDTGWPGTLLTVGQEGFGDALRGLKRLEQLLPVLDPWRLSALVLREYFVQRYGSGGVVDAPLGFLLEAMAVIPSLADEPPAAAAVPVPEADVVAVLRSEFSHGLRQAASAAGAAGDAAEVELDTDWIDQLIERIPAGLRAATTAHTYHVQPIPGEGRVVVGDIMGGFARGAARHAHVLDGQQGGAFAGRLQAYLAGLLPPGQRFMELPGTFGFSASRRPTITDLAFDYPGVPPIHPPQQRVTIADLQLRHLVAENRLQLVHRTTGHELLPLNLGSLTFALTPALFNLFCLLLPAAPVLLSVGALLEQDLPAAQRGEPRRYPRLCIDGAVIARQRWVIPAQHLPRRAKGQEEWSYALEVERWRQHLGLPERVYVRATLDGAVVFRRPAGEEREGPAGELRDQQRKPQYVDFTSPILLRVFERHLEEADEVLVVEEMLPAPHDLLPNPAGDPVVSEWLVEVSHVPITE